MKIAIAGGSIVGLACASTLACTGHDVHVYERSAGPLRGRGGGVVVLRPMLRFLEQHGHRTRTMLAVPTHRRRWIDIDGNVIRDGQRHHASVSPGELSERSLAYLHRAALDGLPRTLSQLVATTDAPFLQAVSDTLSPSFAKGRIALVGDAACTLPPHTGSGTSQSADDAVSLAEPLATVSDTNVVQVLDRWAAMPRGAVAPVLLKGPRLAQSLGLGYPST